jgi:hypothetical protein
MKKDKVYFMCPYLDGSPEGIACNAAQDLIRNIKNINLNICMGRHFELCHVYMMKLREMTVTQEYPNNGEDQVSVTEL